MNKDESTICHLIKHSRSSNKNTFSQPEPKHVHSGAGNSKIRPILTIIFFLLVYPHGALFGSSR